MNFPGACPFCSFFCTGLGEGEAGFGRDPSLCPTRRARLARYEGMEPAPLQEGVKVSWEEAFESAADLIRRARLPLVLLSGEASCAAQAAGAALGRALGACVDTPASAFDSAWAWAVADNGLLTGTIGELQGRTLYSWGTEASNTHPRFIDLILSIRHGLQNKPVTQEAAAWLRALQEAGGGVFLAGPGLARQGWVALKELVRLCTDLEEGGWGRWDILRGYEGCNDLGAMHALQTECGYPGSVLFSSADVEFSPLDWSAERLLLSRETDLAIWVGAESWLNPAAEQRLDCVPNVVVSSLPPAWSPTVWLPVRRMGVDGGGVALRLDGVPVYLAPAVEGIGRHMPGDAPHGDAPQDDAPQVIDALRQAICP